MSILGVLAVLAGSAVVVWLLGHLSRLAQSDRVGSATQVAQAATSRATAAEVAAKELDSELARTRARLTTFEIDSGRLRAEAERVPVLEETLSRLRLEHEGVQKECAVQSAEVKHIPDLKTALKETQQLLLDSREASARVQARADLVPGLEAAAAEERRRADQLQERASNAEQEQARLTAELTEAGTRVQEQLALVEHAQAEFREAFQALSAEALKSNNQAFLDLAKTAMGEVQQGAKMDLEARQTAIGHLLSPVSESLAKFDVAVHDLERNRLEAYTALSTQVVALEKGQKDLYSETGKLVKALRAPSPRGRWGEIQLRRVVEMAGMVEHCDFEEQAHVPTEDGRMRPDVVVHLPGTKTTVVDSKVPLVAYLDSLDAPDEATRRSLLRDHAAHVRKHISQLGSKAYWDQLTSSPDFVVMYVPLESAFAAAMEGDPGLIDYAVEASVVPAGPMTLLTHLKAAAYGWRQERIAANAEQISELGKELYNRLAKLAEHVADVGKHLARAAESYNHAVGSLEHRVLIQARRFKDLGAATGEDIVTLEAVTVAPRGIQAPELVAQQLGPPASGPA